MTTGDDQVATAPGPSSGRAVYVVSVTRGDVTPPDEEIAGTVSATEALGATPDAEVAPDAGVAPDATESREAVAPAEAPIVTSMDPATGFGGVANQAVRPATLAIDVGGTGLKASVLGPDGRLLADRVRLATPYPCPPERMLDELAALAAPLPRADRVSVGFPGVVRKGAVLTAPHFVTASGPGSAIVPELEVAWRSFDLAGGLEHRLGIPVRVANDADLQGWAVVSGTGLEMVVTLGTGVGSALFMDGVLAPHLELAHHPFRREQTYNEQIGDAALREIGPKKWRKRVLLAIDNFERLVNYDHLYVGGGNARHLVGHVDDSITIVDNVAGILGGIKLWEHPLLH